MRKKRLVTAPPALHSEQVILSAPMSYTGSTQRIIRWSDEHRLGQAEWLQALIITGMVLALLGAWLAITCWYCIFGLLLVPYRIGRRSQRRAERDKLRHRELLAAVQAPRPSEPSEAELLAEIRKTL